MPFYPALGPVPSCLKSATKRRPASDWRALHKDEAATLKVFDKPSRHDGRHEFVSVVNALATLEAQRERERVGEVFRRSRSEAL